MALSEKVKEYLYRCLRDRDVVNELDVQATNDNLDLSNYLTNPVVFQTLDPDFDITAGTAGVDFDSGTAVAGVTGIGQSITLTETTTFNEIATSLALNDPTTDSQAQAILKIYHLTNTTIGARVLKTAINFIGKDDTTTPNNNSAIYKFQAPTTTLAAGSYMIVTEAIQKDVRVWIQDNGTYADGKVYDIQLSDNTVVDDFGGVYTQYLVMRYNP